MVEIELNITPFLVHYISSTMPAMFIEVISFNPQFYTSFEDEEVVIYCWLISFPVFNYICSSNGKFCHCKHH
jgi:hypothetical protein